MNSKVKLVPSLTNNTLIDTITEPPTIPIYQLPSLSILVKESRMRYRLTQTELSQRTSIPHTEISRIESGKIRKPSKDVLKALCPYTGVSYSKLLLIAGHSGSKDNTEYFSSNGIPILHENIIDEIYSADSDLLFLLQGINSYTSFDDLELLKDILMLMKYTHNMQTQNDAIRKVQAIFSATKKFLIVHFKDLLSRVKLSSDNYIYDGL